MKMKSLLRRNLLLVATLTSIVFGAVIGVVCRQFNPPDDVMLLVGFPGDLFFRMLKLLTLPLIISSIITGIGNLKGSSAGRMGVVSMCYYSSTTVISLLIALTIGLTIRPGEQSDYTSTNLKQNAENAKLSGFDIFMDLLRNLVPDNIIAALIKHTRTATKSKPEGHVGSNYSRSSNISEMTRSMKEVRLFDGANIIGVLLYCVVFGVILSRMGRQGRVIIKLFTAVNTITLQMIKLVTWYSPVGIMFLVASQVTSAEDLSKTGKTLGIYVAADMTALTVHFLLAMPLFYFILTRGNAYKVYLGALQAFVTAFATSSSAATLPVTVQCLEQRLKMDPRIVGFILPIGMTVNMDGGAVLGVMAPIFVSLYNGIILSFTDLLIISVSSLLMSVGVGAVPQAGIPIILLVLETVNLPYRGMAFIIAIDSFIDRVRTVVNVGGDCLAVGVTTRYTNLAPEQEGREEEENVHNALSCGDGQCSLSSDAFA